jgi:hypothetical protein
VSDKPKDPESTPEVEREITLEIGLISNPEQFEVGLANQLGNSPMLVFLRDGKPSHAIAFQGDAGEKLLLSMLGLVDLLHGIGVEEAAKFVMPENKAKKPTLH